MQAVLSGGRPVTLRFDIGPKWKTSDVKNAVPSAEILNSRGDVHLTVVLACDFCEPRADSSKRITFRPALGRSEEVLFKFTPKRRPDGKSYAEKLQLSIINDGTGAEYDRLVVAVKIAGDSPIALVAPIISAVFEPSRATDGTDWQPDVVLYADEDMSRRVSISLEPISAGMRSRLGPFALNKKGRRRVFQSGIDDADLISAMTNSAYGAMSAVSLQGELLKKLSSTGKYAAVSKSSQDSLVLSDIESSNVAKLLADVGKRLYRHLYYGDAADPQLRTLIEQLEIAADLEEFKDRPLRIKVVTNRLTLPWQYLHPVGPDVDPMKFWGMRFSLSVHRVNNRARAKSVEPGMSQAKKVVFAHYGRSADPTVPLAEKQAAQLQLLPLGPGELVKVDTGRDLLGKVSTERKQIAGIVTFLHASAGSADTPPQLQFNEGDVVTSDNFDELLSQVSAAEQDLRYLAGAPLVILNACETGPSRNLPQVKLQNAMFMLGARGVVVTEVSVWITLGHEVATQLIERLTQGEPVSDALTAVRRDLLVKRRNPLGLLYVYYGDPAATLRR